MRLKDRRRSLISTLTVGLFALIMAVCATVIVVAEQRSAEAQAGRRMQAEAALTQAYVAEQIAGIGRLVAADADRFAASGVLTPGRPLDSRVVRAGLVRMREARPDVILAVLTRADGILVGAQPISPRLAGRNLGYRDWFQGAVRTGLPYTSEVYRSAAAGHAWVVAVSSVIRGPKVGQQPGPVAGVLAAIYSVAAFQRFVDAYAVRTGIRLAIVDQHGVLVAEGGRTRGADDTADDRRAAGRNALTGPDVIAASVVDSNTGWRIGSGIPISAAYQSSAGFRWVVIAAAGLVVLMVMGAAVAEARIRRNRRRDKEEIEQFFGVSLDLLCIAGADGYFKRVNPAWQAVLGYDEEELLSRPFLSFVHPDDVGRTQAVLDQVAGGTSSLGFENRYRCEDGTYRWLLWQAAAVPDRRVLYAAARDITRRKRTEQELARLAAIVDSSVDAIIGADLDGTITSWNNGAVKMFGYPADEVLGRSIRILAPDDHAEQDDKLARAALGESIPPYEATRTRRDGQAIEVALSKSPVRDPDGTVVGVALIARDVTEKKRSAEALGAIIDSASDPFVSIDSDGNVTEWNHRAETLFGWRRDEVLGRDLAELVVPEASKQAHRDGIRNAFTGGGSGILDRSRDIVAVRRDGTEVPAEITVWPVSTRSGLQFSAFIRDVGQRQQFEQDLAAARDEALEASRLKSEFLAMMSHEIRTPMNGVIGLTGLLLRGELNETARYYAERIRVAGKALLTVINDVLDFSKIEAGALIIDDSVVSLRAVLEEVLELVAESARGKGLELVGHCDVDVPDQVRGDPVRIRQILLNFAVNAVKFTEHGEVFVHIRRGDGTAREAPAPDTIAVRLEVQDTGIGIAPELRGLLFDAFAQADSSTTRRFGGTGLGLAICRKLAEAMGGEVGVRSQPGSGSVFWCHLPMLASPAAAPAPPPGHTTPAGLRILVVDDNATSRHVLTQVAHAWSMVPTAVSSGVDAIGALRTGAADGRPFDVVITDLDMPGMDGLRLARLIAGHPQIAGLPVVLMTTDQPALPAEAQQSGIVATLTKPIQQSQLYDCLIEIAATLSPTSQADPARAVGADAGTTVRAPADGARLLLAEDNQTNQIVAVGVLKELGYEVDVADDGVQALAMFNRRPYDAVLLDCQMPNMDGYETAGEIRRREAAGRHGDAEPPARTPIIAMTAAALKGDRDRCYAAGMDDYLTKPFEPDDLATALHRWIGDERGGREARPAVDPDIAARLERLRGYVPPATIERFRTSFASDGDRCIAALGAALGAADAGRLAGAAHSLRGAASGIGATALASLCETLEGLATAGNLNDAPTVFAGVQTAYAYAMDTLREIEMTDHPGRGERR